MANLESIILKDSGGTEADVTASNALKVDGSAVTQPVSGTVTINAIPAGSAAIGKLAANDAVDIGDVTVNNASGASAVNIQDGGNSITVDGTVAVSGTVTVAAHAVTNAGTFAAQIDGAALTALQLIDNIVRTEDEASADGHSGVVMLAVRKATPANVSGTDGDYEMPQMSAGRLWASATIDAAIPAGTNNIGDVDVLTLPALPAGTNNIGDVDVLTLPALPTGSNVIGALTANQSVNTAQINGVTPLMGAGNTGTGSPRVTIATDQAVIPTNPQPQTTGGLTTYHLVSAGSTNATVVKASAGQLYAWYIYNSNAAARKLAFHNTASTPTAGASIFMTFVIPPTAGANVALPFGIAFSAGIAITTVTGLADNDSAAVAANDLIINLYYK